MYPSFANSINTIAMENITNKSVIMALRKRPRRPLVKYRPLNRENLVKIVDLLELTSIKDCNERAKLFIGFCHSQNYTNSTTKLYFDELRRAGIFESSTLRPNHKIFGNRGTTHTRMCSRDDFKIFYKYLSDNMNETVAPLMLPVVTGLRSFEVVQLDTNHLKQLLNQETVVDLKRKNTKTDRDALLWEPTYTTFLIKFIKLLSIMFAETISLSEKMEKPIKLFNITRQTLNIRFRTYFYRATDTYPPHGFGVHSCRNMIATEMAATSDNIAAIQKYLQHSQIETTQRYIKSDFNHTTQQFNKLTRDKFQNVQYIMSSFLNSGMGKLV